MPHANTVVYERTEELPSIYFPSLVCLSHYCPPQLQQQCSEIEEMLFGEAGGNDVLS